METAHATVPHGATSVLCINSVIKLLKLITHSASPMFLPGLISFYQQIHHGCFGGSLKSVTSAFLYLKIIYICLYLIKRNEKLSNLKFKFIKIRPLA